jgi:hypothetical protein
LSEEDEEPIVYTALATEEFVQPDSVARALIASLVATVTGEEYEYPLLHTPEVVAVGVEPSTV